jgi:hypothetical protein
MEKFLWKYEKLDKGIPDLFTPIDTKE